MDLKVTHENTTDCRIKIDLDIPAEALKAEYETAKKEVITRVTIPGFRKGKVPDAIVKKKFKHSIEEKMISKTISKAYQEAIKQKNLQPYGHPHVEKISPYQEGKSLQATILVDRRPSCKIDYEAPLSLTKDEYVIEEADIDIEIKDMLLKNHTTYTDEDIVRDENYIVQFDLRFTEEALQKKSTTGQVIAMNEDFSTDALEIRKEFHQMKVNQKKQIQKTFPKNFYDTDLAGKTTQLELKVIKIQRMTVAALTEDVIKQMGYASKKEMRQMIKTNLETWASHKIQEQLRQSVLKEMIAHTTFEIPKSAIEMVSKSYMENLYKAYNHNTFLLEDTLKKQGKNLDELKQSYETLAVETLQTELFTSTLINEQNIQVSDKDMEKYIQESSSYNKEPYEAHRKKMIQNGKYTQLKNNLKTDMALDFLLKKVKLHKGNTLSMKALNHTS